MERLLVSFGGLTTHFAQYPSYALRCVGKDAWNRKYILRNTRNFQVVLVSRRVRWSSVL